MKKRIRSILNENSLAEYCINRMTIIIGKDTPCFTKQDNDKYTHIERNIHIFLHEYYHFLQNFTTITGLQSFLLWQDLLAEFSNVIRDDGTCTGSIPDSDAQKEILAIINEILAAFGDSEPENCPEDKNVVDIEIRDSILDDRVFMFRNEPAKRHNLNLSLTTHFDDGSTIENSYKFGEIAIIEGLAYEIDRMVEGAVLGKKEVPDDSPFFPYRMLREIAFFYLKDIPLHRITLIALGTLSLLTNDSPYVLTILLEEYKKLHENGKTPKEALTILWENSREQVRMFVNTCIDSLNSYIQQHHERGILEEAAKHVSEFSTKALLKRIEEPFFDIIPFTTNTANLKEVFQILNTWLPCVTIQERDEGETDITKDILVGFGDQKKNTDAGLIVSSDFMCTVNTQLHYMFTHLDLDVGFIPSMPDEDSLCPFFSCCPLPLKKNHEDICATEPWKSYSKEEEESCWYGHGVAATIGKVRVKRIHR